MLEVEAEVKAVALLSPLSRPSPGDLVWPVLLRARSQPHPAQFLQGNFGKAAATSPTLGFPTMQVASSNKRGDFRRLS